MAVSKGKINQSPITDSKRKRSRVTAALLAILFGAFGLHKFLDPKDLKLRFRR